jgi:signal transduction histidine kinase
MSSQMLIEKFIYSCSHDLRAPVSSIQGLVRIAEYYTHHEETHKCLQMIEACAYKMNKMIATLQEYMVNQQRPLTPEPVEAVELIDALRDEFKPQLDGCAIELIADVDPGCVVNLDRHAVLQVLRQLVFNSISYHDPTRTGRKIWLRIALATPDQILVTITDNGKGISEDQQQRIFDMFYRATEHSIGIGMGLFLAHSLVEKMAGTIKCRSAVGHGTSIEICLPS